MNPPDQNSKKTWTQTETVFGLIIASVIMLALTTTRLERSVAVMQNNQPSPILALTTHIDSTAETAGWQLPSRLLSRTTNQLWGTSILFNEDIKVTEPKYFEVKPKERIPETLQITKRKPTDESPLRIWTGGDSLGQYMGFEMQNMSEGLYEIETSYTISSGLTNPEYFNWPYELQKALQQYNPDVAILFLGANDDKDFPYNNESIAAGSDEWFRLYELRINELVDVSISTETHIKWILLPVMDDPLRNKLANGINSIIERSAETYDHIEAVPISEFITDDETGFDYYISKFNDETIKVRQADGVHITQKPSKWIARKLIRDVLGEWPKLHQAQSEVSQQEQPQQVTP